MSKCYNAECPFSKGWCHDCDCSDLCGGYTSEKVTVYTTNRTEPEFLEGIDLPKVKAIYVGSADGKPIKIWDREHGFIDEQSRVGEGEKDG